MKILQPAINVFLGCLVAYPTAGQPVLTRANTITATGVQNLETPVQVVGISPGAAGISAMWDFSAIGSNFYDTSSFVDCPSVPHCGDYTGANLVKQYGVSHYVMPNFEYYRIADDKLEFLGGYFMSGVIAPYLDAFTVLSYPLSYGDAFVDSFGYVEYGTTVVGADTATADAYGTLLLPSGTYSNVLRLRRRIVENVVLGYTSPDGSIQDVYIDSYEWWSAEHKTRLLQINYRMTIANTTRYDTSVRYYTGTVPNRVDGPEEVKDGSVFPNPATTRVIVRSTAKNCVVKFYDMLGRLLLECNLSEGQSTIDVTGLPRGMCLMTIDNHRPQRILLE